MAGFRTEKHGGAGLAPNCMVDRLAELGSKSPTFLQAYM